MRTETVLSPRIDQALPETIGNGQLTGKKKVLYGKQLNTELHSQR